MEQPADARYLTPSGETVPIEECYARIPGDKAPLPTLVRRLRTFRATNGELPSLDEIIAMATRPVRVPGEKVHVGGKVYPSLTAAAEAHGLSQPVLWRRMKQEGLSPDEAVAQHAKGNQGQRVTVGGRTFPSIKAAARVFQICPETLRHRLNVRGLPPGEAVRRPR